MVTYTDEEAEVIRRCGEAELDGGRRRFVELHPLREPIAFVTAELLVAKGVLERVTEGVPWFRLSPSARLLLAATAAEHGQAGRILTSRRRRGRR